MKAVLRLDLDNQCLWRSEERIALPPKAFLVLRELNLNSGALVTKRHLLETVWPDTYVGDAVLTVTVKQIRDLVGDDARRPWFIETVHRRGFRLIGELGAGLAEPAASAAPATASARRPADLIVGRDDELAQLGECWSDVLEGRRQVVFVTGEAGIGKTALVETFLQSLPSGPQQSPAVLIGRGHCLEGYGSNEAYLPILDALEDLQRGSPSPELHEILCRYAPSWLAQMPWLLNDRDSSRVQESARGATRERLLREMSTAFEMSSLQTPVILALEDLHWSDPSTVTLLSFLGQRRQPARLLIIGTYRPVDVIVAHHPIRDARQRLETGGRCIEVSLSYLNSDDVRQLLQARLDGAVDDRVVDLAYARSNGNPLFLTSLIGHLMGSGGLVERGGAWHAAADPAATEQVPAELRQIIERTLEGLSEIEVRALEVASVAGLQFPAAAVGCCLAADAAQTDQLCERLARRGDLLRSAGTSRLGDGQVTGRYEFVHALVQNVLYQRIAPARRMHIHHQLGTWGEGNGATVGELAHHFAASSSTATVGKAIAFAQKAAARSRAVFAYEEAISHCAAALRLARSQPVVDARQECALQVALAEAQQRAGHIVVAEQTFHAAALQARALSEAELLARAAVGIGHGYQRMGQPDPLLIELLEAALEQLGPADHPLRALALAHLDYSLASVPGSLARRSQLAEEALAMARRLDDAETLVWVMQYTRWSFRGPQHAEDWRAGIREIEALLPRATDPEHALVLRYLLTTDLLDLGDVEQARQNLTLLTQSADEAQLPWFLWLVLRLRSTLALLCGDFAAAETLIQQTLEAGARTDHPNVMQLYGGQTTLLRIEQGRLQEIEPMLRAAVEQNPNVPTWRAVRALVATELGDLDDARRQFEIIAHADFSDIPRDTAWFVFMGMTAVTCCALKDRRRAAAMYEALLPYKDRSTGVGSSLFSLGHMERYLGVLAATLGDLEQAAQHFSRALAENERMGALPWAVFTRRDWARMQLEARSKAERQKAIMLLQPAIATAQRIGMTGWIDPLQQLCNERR